MIDKLRQLKEESHMTNQQIAEKSNVPESTVARIISGKTPYHRRFDGAGNGRLCRRHLRGGGGKDEE